MTIVIVYGRGRDPGRRPAHDLPVAEDGVHPVQPQLRDRGEGRGRPPRRHPRRQGAARARTATRARRRSASTTTRTPATASTAPLRRRPDGTFEEIDWDTAIREVAGAARRGSATSTAATRSSTTAAAARGTTSAARSPARRGPPSACATCRTRSRRRRPASSGWTGSCSAGRAATRRRDFEHAEVAMFVGKNPWHSHGFPRARVVLKEIAKDPARALIVIDPRRTEDRGAGRLPPAGAARHGRLLPRRAARACSWRRTCSTTTFLAAHARDGEALFAELRARADRASTAAAPASTRTSCAPSRGASRAASSVSILEDLGIQQAPHTTLNSYLEKLLYLLTGNFGKPGGDEPPHRASRRLGGDFPRDTRDAGHRRADHHRADPRATRSPTRSSPTTRSASAR